MKDKNKLIFQQTISLEIVKGPPEEIDQAISKELEIHVERGKQK